jgi:hypothetical protein
MRYKGGGGGEDKSKDISVTGHEGLHSCEMLRTVQLTDGRESWKK